MLETIREYGPGTVGAERRSVPAASITRLVLRLPERVQPGDGSQFSLAPPAGGRARQPARGLRLADRAGRRARRCAWPAAVRCFWIRGHLSEGRNWLERALALPVRRTPGPARAWALIGAGDGRVDQLAHRPRAAGGPALTLTDGGYADCLRNGRFRFPTARAGDYALHARLASESRSIFRELTDLWSIVAASCSLDGAAGPGRCPRPRVTKAIAERPWGYLGASPRLCLGEVPRAGRFDRAGAQRTRGDSAPRRQAQSLVLQSRLRCALRGDARHGTARSRPGTGAYAGFGDGRGQGRCLEGAATIAIGSGSRSGRRGCSGRRTRCGRGLARRAAARSQRRANGPAAARAALGEAVFAATWAAGAGDRSTRSSPRCSGWRPTNAAGSRRLTPTGRLVRTALREREVLRLARRRPLQPRDRRRLFISPKTVRNHVTTSSPSSGSSRGPRRPPSPCATASSERCPLY